jgi:glycerate 2-kinase
MVLRRTPSRRLERGLLDPPADARGLLASLYWAAVEAVSPGRSLLGALERSPPPRSRRVWVIAIGKASHAMAGAAVDWLRGHGIAPAGGIIIAPSAAVPPHPGILLAVGDHPLPGARSFAAAARLGEVAARMGEEDEAWVLLSGGASALAAAPEGAIKPDELVELFRLLLRSGLDIARANAVRKRFLRWGAGRLAVALQPARVRNFIISDVVGDDIDTIGSGPCAPDATDASAVRALLEEAGLWDRVAVSLRRYLGRVARDSSAETPKPNNPIFQHVERRIVAGNRIALDAASARAAEYGFAARVVSASLSGPAADAGRRVAQALLAYRSEASRVCLLWGGETTVSVGARSGRGGRCQELALAAARELTLAQPESNTIAILAAGSDGRDGPTDAAGAFADSGTWNAIQRAGHDPALALEGHDSYRALDAADSLFRTGLTGTNVMDLVIGIAGGGGGAERSERSER